MIIIIIIIIIRIRMIMITNITLSFLVLFAVLIAVVNKPKL